MNIGEFSLLAPTGARMSRTEYLAYLARCSDQWRGMGRPEQAEMVDRMIARVKRMRGTVRRKS